MLTTTGQSNSATNCGCDHFGGGCVYVHCEEGGGGGEEDGRWESGVSKGEGREKVV